LQPTNSSTCCDSLAKLLETATRELGEIGSGQGVLVTASNILQAEIERCSGLTLHNGRSALGRSSACELTLTDLHCTITSGSQSVALGAGALSRKFKLLLASPNAYV